VISLQDAQSLVESMIAETDLPDGDIAVFLEDETVARHWGWVFFYQSLFGLSTPC
jgi:hypothetical protein